MCKYKLLNCHTVEVQIFELPILIFALKQLNNRYNLGGTSQIKALMNCNRTIICRLVLKLAHSFGLTKVKFAISHNDMHCVYIYSTQTNFHKKCYQDQTNNLFTIVTAR